MTKKIQNNNFVYSFFFRLIKYIFPISYRRMEHSGKNNIPDGGIIFAPNHTNALMDALVVLFSDFKPKVFVARADMFKNKYLAKILTALKILPIMRIRDGWDEVKKNDIIIEKSVDVLMDRVPFVILPEGTHNAQHSLLPIGKGIFRIAITAQQNMKDDTPVYIIPLGIVYGNFFRLRSTALLKTGRPINIKEFLAKNNQLTTPEMYNILKLELEDRLREIIFYIPNDSDYNAVLQICSLNYKYYGKDTQFNSPVIENNSNIGTEEQLSSLEKNLYYNRASAAKIQHIKDTDINKYREMIEAASEISKIRLEAKISEKSIIKSKLALSFISRLLVVVAALPFFLASAIICSPIHLINYIICSKSEDKAFLNSIRFVITLLLLPIIVIVGTIIAANIFSLCCFKILLVALLLSTTFTISQEYYRNARLAFSDFKLLRHNVLRRKITSFEESFLR